MIRASSRPAKVAPVTGPSSAGSRAVRLAESGLVWAAKLLFPLHRGLSERWPGPRVKPKWAPAPIIRKAERSFPTLGWPRQTDSLCPECVKAVRADILDGRLPLSELVTGKPGEIRAEIIEEDGRVLMRKRCPVHGEFEDVMSISPPFLQRIERLFPGRDYKVAKSALRNHGTSSIQYGRGSVLTVDLTNRCNMMCDPCFMDANQVGYVHELTWEDITKILNDSLSQKPRRQMSVQFSGGEPTLSPFFLDAVAYARKAGYFCVQAASNGIRFAQEPEFCRAAKQAGLRLVYLQFDGVSNQAHAHRKVGNLFDVKRAAIDNLHAAGVDVVLVVTVVRGVNDEQVGPIVEFAIENADKITVVSFQPVSFTGRDEDISDERRHAQRYTLSHLAQDLSTQLGATEPMRDWFPLSAMNPFSDVVDVLLGPDTDFGALKCGCHPNCGIGTVLVVNKRTKEWAPICEFIDVEQVLKDLQQVADSGKGRAHIMSGVALSLARNFRPEKAPAGYGLTELVKQCMSQAGATGDAVGTTEGDAAAFEWRFLFVAGMWFQDLFNYDFRRTEMCIIPYGTQQGEISFCAYNTGVGWRQIIEQMHLSAKVADWYREHGRHPVYAKDQVLELPGSAAAPKGPKKRLVVLES